MAAADAIEFRRILVALDASKESLVALEAAAALAACLHAELTGLFIEDTDLLNLAAFPFSREAPALSRSGRLLEPEQLERDLRTKAAMARQALARTADAFQLQWSFRVARGRVAAELLAAAAEADLVAVGKGTRPLSGQARLGRQTRVVAARSARSMLFAAVVSAPRAAALAAVYDGSAPARAALVLAAQLSERHGQRLLAVVLGEADEFAAREIAVRDLLRSVGVSAAIRRVRGPGLEEILRVVRAEPVALLVVGAPALPSDEEIAVDMLVEKSPCSVLLVRG